MHKIQIALINGSTIEFTGKYRRDLEKPNWHYYEDEDGDLHHFRKEHMVMVSDIHSKETAEHERNQV